MTFKQLLHKISWRVPWRGRPRSSSRSASASRSTATCRPSSDAQPSSSRSRARHRAQCCGRRLLGQAVCAMLALPSRLMASARFCLTLLLTPDLRAQTQAAAFTAPRRPARGPIAAVDRRRGCEVDYIAAEVVNCCAGAATFAAIVDDIAKLFGAARALPRRRDRAEKGFAQN